VATLTIEQFGARQAGTLRGRVLIGRWPQNTIVIDDNSVSRIHAWIGVQDDHYYIADSGSRTGTMVNGQPLRERHFLSDGDEILIGPAFLRYQADDTFPPDAQEIDLTPRSAEELSGTQGQFIDCVCGAPLWLPKRFLGAGQCRYCGHTVQATPSPAPHPGPPPTPPEFPIMPKAPAMAGPTPPPAKSKKKPSAGRVLPPPAPLNRRPPRTAGSPITSRPKPVRIPPGGPQPPPLMPMPVRPMADAPLPPPITPVRPTPYAPEPAAVMPPPAIAPQPQAPSAARPTEETACGVCHSPITIFDEVTTCSSCGLMFHAECWAENRGCSSYGCAEVGVLDKE
jgi:predicted component of type VI protein secretion system